MKIGIIGVGHLAKSMLTGFLRANLDPQDFLLSPRGQAQQLAKEHHFALARDNHHLVEACDIVILAVRPKDVAAAVAGLPWREGQLLICVCAGVALNELAVAPACVVRAMPLTAAEINASPTICFPPHAEAVRLLEYLGTPICVTNERAFEVATVNAAVYGWVQNLIRITANWSAQHLEQFSDQVCSGFDQELRGKQTVETQISDSIESHSALMRRLVSLTFAGAGRMLAEKPEPMEDLLAALVTPGGITELGLEKLKAHGFETIWQEVCASVLERLDNPIKNFPPEEGEGRDK